MYSLHKYLQNTFYKPGTSLGFKYTLLSKALAFMKLQTQREENLTKYSYK